MFDLAFRLDSLSLWKLSFYKREYSLQRCLQWDSVTILQMLLEDGYEVNSEDLIEECIKNSSIKCLKILVEDFYIKMEWIDSAIKNSSSLVLEVLLKGVEENYLQGMNHLWKGLFLDKEEGEVLKMMGLLLSKGLQVNDSDKILVEASTRGYDRVIIECLELGLDLKWRDNEALYEAGINGHFSTIKLLIEKGAEPLSRNSTVLQHVSWTENLELLEYLLDKGCDITANNYKAVKIAVRKDNLDVFKSFLNGRLEKSKLDSIIRYGLNNSRGEIKSFLTYNYKVY